MFCVLLLALLLSLFEVGHWNGVSEEPPNPSSGNWKGSINIEVGSCVEDVDGDAHAKGGIGANQGIPGMLAIFGEGKNCGCGG